MCECAESITLHLENEQLKIILRREVGPILDHAQLGHGFHLDLLSGSFFREWWRANKDFILFGDYALEPFFFFLWEHGERPDDGGLDWIMPEK